MQDTVPMGMAPFESVSELQEAHTTLLEALDNELGQDANADNEVAALAQLEMKVRQFLERGAATGIYVEEIKERTSCQVLLNYWVSSLSQAGMEVSSLRLAQFDGLKLPDLKDKPCPYVGLDAFRGQEFFFGREADTQKLLTQVHEAALVVVLGASGSGKSSLVMGGVLPALTGSGTMPELIVVPPFVPGNAVLDGLARAVLQVGSGEDNLVAEAVAQLRQNPLHLSLMVGGADAPPTLITIDQFEEVFTLITPTDREALVENLTQLLEAGRGHRVILTVREEFRSRIVELRALSPYLDKAWYSMRPMSYEELKAAVERPAALVNLQFQSGIVDDLVKKVLGQPAALPLLQFALRALWEKRDRNRITREVYQKVGDPLIALKASADQFYDRQAQQTQDEVKRILLELVRVDELLEAYRQPVPRSHLMQAGKANTEEALTLLAENDYVRISPSVSDTDAVVEVKHESLIRNWPRFVAWIDEKRLQRRQRLALTQAAERWAQNGKPQEGLLTGWQLQEAKDESDLLEIEQEFVQASAEAADHMQREKEKTQAHAIRVKIIAISFGILFLIVAGFSFVLWETSNKAEKAQRHAEELLGFLLGERFLGEIRDVGRSSLLEQVQKKVQEYETTQGQGAAMIRGLALRHAGDIERMHGQTKKSLTLFEQALEAIESSAETPYRAREAARTHARLGEVLSAQGHITQALSHYQASEKAWRRVVKDSADVQVKDCTSFADSLVSRGEVENRMGEPAAAWKDVDEAHNIVTTVPFGRCGALPRTGELYPDVKAIEVLSRAQMLRGSIFNSKNDYEAAVYLANKARQLSPESTSAMTQKATAVAFLANYKSFDKPQDALEDYRLALTEFDGLQRKDSTNRLWVREQAAVQLLIADGIAKGIVVCRQSKVTDCKTMPSIEEGEVPGFKALATVMGLAEADPNSMSLQRDLAWAWQVRAKMLEVQDRQDERLAALKESERLYRASIDDPSDADGLSQLGYIVLDQTKALADLGRWPEAKAELKRAISMFEHFKERDGVQGSNLLIVNYLSTVRTEEVTLLRKSGDNKGADLAEQERKRLEDQYYKLYQDISGNSEEETLKLMNSHSANVIQGAELFRKDSYSAALDKFNAAEGAMRKFIDLQPTDFKGYDNLGNIYNWVQLTQEKLDNAKEAAAAQSVMIHMAWIATLLNPELDAQGGDDKLRVARQSVAQFLYNKEHFDEALAYNQQEIADAEKLLGEAPNDALHLRNLGNAYFGKGMVRRSARKSAWEEAIRVGIAYGRQAVDLDKKNSDYPKELGGYHKYLADEFNSDGLKEKALTEYGLALEAYKKASRLSAGDETVRDAIRELEKLVER